MQNNTRLRLRVQLPSNDTNVPSLTAIYPGANFYEREVFDLFGITFTDHPFLHRLLLPDYATGHPLRKDHPLGYEAGRVHAHVRRNSTRQARCSPAAKTAPTHRQCGRRSDRNSADACRTCDAVVGHAIGNTAYQYGPASSVYARRLARRARSGRRENRQRDARHRLLAHGHRKERGIQDVPQSDSAVRPNGLYRDAVQQSGVLSSRSKS